MVLPFWEIVLRLSLASLFGAVIGLERERKDWAAGLRTHMMVCLGASLAMMVSVYGFSDILGSKNVVLDPSRIAAQVISGIGFIGAGTILFLKDRVVRGLTTAAGLWTVAAIGLATGCGMYFAAFVATLFALIILWTLQPLEKKFAERFLHRDVRVVTVSRTKAVEILNSFSNLPTTSIIFSSIEQTDANEFTVSIRFGTVNRDELKKAIVNLHSDDTIKKVTWNG